MKNLLILFCCLFTLTSYAQQYTDTEQSSGEEVKSLLAKGKEMTGFGNVDFRISQMMDAQSLLIGGYGGLLLNKNVMFGVGAYGLAANTEFSGVDPMSNVAKDLTLYGGYGGLLLGFKIASKEIIHLSVPILIGGGHLDVSDDNYFSNYTEDRKYDLESSAYFAVEPSALLEINVSQRFRLGMGAGYRLVRGLNLENVEDDDMSGFSGVVSFQIGNF